MSSQFARTEMLIGEAAMKKLRNSRVAVFGMGGVGGFVAEALARAGVGSLDIIDNDVFDETNLNRQILALHSTIGKSKVLVAKERLADINPKLNVNIFQCFYLADSAAEFDFSAYDYVADAIDTVSGKISLIAECRKHGTPIISAMGAGNKLDPTALKIADIAKTSVCPLAKIIRKKLRELGINHVKVVFSTETAIKPLEGGECGARRQTPGSISFVPSVMGLLMAKEIVTDLIKEPI